jgi:tRNA nucleotidyltransferase/poly(A) polymerase
MDPGGSKYPINDLDVVVDSIALGKNSEWFANQLAKAIPAPTNLTTNQYGVVILTIKGEWELEGHSLKGEILEIANARKESYGGAEGKGKGYKPTDVQPATIEEDINRRDFTLNSLLWRLLDLANGPDYAEVIDLTGLGVQHLEERMLHTPLDPDRTFSDDPTRMLRLIKFSIKYELDLTDEVAASVRRNAPKMKKMPWEAIATILVQDILDTPNARGALLTMAHLGLIETLSEMIQSEAPFASYMAKQFSNGNRAVALLLDLADLGLGSQPVAFLTKPQQVRLREITTGMISDEADEFFEKLKKPPIDNTALITEFNLQGRDRGALAPLAREAMLSTPMLAFQPDRLQDAVRAALGTVTHGGRTAGYYSNYTGLGDVIANWQKLGDKMYEDDMPVMVRLSELLPYREYVWTRDKARLEPHEWDELMDSMNSRGWKKGSTVHLQIGRKGGVKVGEGNHRLAIAAELGIERVPVFFHFYDGHVTKG